MRVVRLRDVGAGEQGAVGVAGLHDDVALFAQLGEVIAHAGLHFLCVESIADVGFHFFQGLQSRLETPSITNVGLSMFTNLTDCQIRITYFEDLFWDGGD